MENPIKMDDLGVSLFSETSIWSNWFGQVFGQPYCSPSLPLKKQLDGFNAGTECLQRHAQKRRWWGHFPLYWLFNISHLGKRKIIFKMPFLGDIRYVSFLEGNIINY